jgi:hypothetical protein
MDGIFGLLVTYLYDCERGLSSCGAGTSSACISIHKAGV